MSPFFQSIMVFYYSLYSVDFGTLSILNSRFSTLTEYRWIYLIPRSRKIQVARRLAHQLSAHAGWGSVTPRLLFIKGVEGGLWGFNTLAR